MTNTNGPFTATSAVIALALVGLGVAGLRAFAQSPKGSEVFFVTPMVRPPLMPSMLILPPETNLVSTTLSNLARNAVIYAAVTAFNATNRVESDYSMEAWLQTDSRGSLLLSWRRGADNGIPVGGHQVYYGGSSRTYTNKQEVIEPPIPTNIALHVWAQWTTNLINWVDDKIIYSVTNPPGGSSKRLWRLDGRPHRF